MSIHVPGLVGTAVGMWAYMSLVMIEAFPEFSVPYDFPILGLSLIAGGLAFTIVHTAYQIPNTIGWQPWKHE